MLTAPDFKVKQIVFVFTNQGDKLSFRNENLIVTNHEGKIKFQHTCYRIFLVCIIGSISITSGILQNAKKYGFQIVLMTQGLKPYQTLGSFREGNTYLRRLQYQYSTLEIPKAFLVNKVKNQQNALISIRNKTDMQKKAIEQIAEYIEGLQGCVDIPTLMGFEGSASRIYFKNLYSNYEWQSRKPRIKPDPINVLLDIGYSMLFGYIECVLNCFGFDLYCGVLHRAFYMRKSLVCDFVEPFRVLIDLKIRKMINLRQFDDKDFECTRNQFFLKREMNIEYVQNLIEPILANKESIFLYVQGYYRAFMKKQPIECYPYFEISSAE